MKWTRFVTAMVFWDALSVSGVDRFTAVDASIPMGDWGTQTVMPNNNRSERRPSRILGKNPR
jgi:hypothetical protein